MRGVKKIESILQNHAFLGEGEVQLVEKFVSDLAREQVASVVGELLGVERRIDVIDLSEEGFFVRFSEGGEGMGDVGVALPGLELREVVRLPQLVVLAEVALSHVGNKINESTRVPN